jgi:hypothetical protein
MAYRASPGVLARSSGSGFRPGLSSPTDSHVEQAWLVLCADDRLGPYLDWMKCLLLCW